MAEQFQAPFRVTIGLREQRRNTPYRKKREHRHLIHRAAPGSIRVPRGQSVRQKRMVHGRRFATVRRKHEGLFMLSVTTPKKGLETAAYRRAVALGAAIAAHGSVAARTTAASSRAAYYHAYYEAHKAARQAYQKAYYKKNRAKVLKAHVKYDRSVKGQAAQRKAHASLVARGYKPKGVQRA